MLAMLSAMTRWRAARPCMAWYTASMVTSEMGMSAPLQNGGGHESGDRLADAQGHGVGASRAQAVEQPQDVGVVGVAGRQEGAAERLGHVHQRGQVGRALGGGREEVVAGDGGDQLLGELPALGQGGADLAVVGVQQLVLGRQELVSPETGQAPEALVV